MTSKNLAVERLVADRSEQRALPVPQASSAVIAVPEELLKDGYDKIRSRFNYNYKARQFCRARHDI